MPGVLASTLIGNIATMSVCHHGALECRSTSRSAFKVGWTCDFSTWRSHSATAAHVRNNTVLNPMYCTHVRMTIHVKVHWLDAYIPFRKKDCFSSDHCAKRKPSVLSVGELNPGLPRAIIAMTGGNTNHYTNRD
jgi:hypothetical protein